MIYNLAGKYHYFGSRCRYSYEKHRGNESFTRKGKDESSDSMSWIPNQRLALRWMINFTR